LAIAFAGAKSVKLLAQWERQGVSVLQTSQATTVPSPPSTPEPAAPRADADLERYRVNLASREPRDRPLVAMVLSVTPIREGQTILAWRMIGKKPIDRAPFGLVDRAAVHAAYRYFYNNVHEDLEILKTMRRLDKPIWVEADGPSIRAYRAYYDRNCAAPAAGWAGRVANA
jgi:hypothetical protein